MIGATIWDFPACRRIRGTWEPMDAGHSDPRDLEESRCMESRVPVERAPTWNPAWPTPALPSPRPALVADLAKHLGRHGDLHGFRHRHERVSLSEMLAAKREALALVEAQP